MPDLNDLNLTDEAVPEVDWDAPESGAFPPQIMPGTHDFKFKLSDDPWGAVSVDGKNFFQLTFEAETEDGKVLKFQRVSTFLNDKMRAAHMNHGAGELLRALGFRISTPLTKEVLADAFKQADAEGRRFKGEVGWRRYCKGCKSTVSTHPRKKKAEIAWPYAGPGKPELVVSCPTCGDKGFGNADIMRFKLPATGAATVTSSTASLSI